MARTHATGLHYAGWMAAHWATGHTGIQLLGLVVLDDAPRLPPVLVTEIKRVAGMVPTLWHLPWVEAWRTSLDLDLATVPRRTRRSITQIRRAAETARAQEPGVVAAPQQDPHEFPRGRTVAS